MTKQVKGSFQEKKFKEKERDGGKTHILDH